MKQLTTELLHELFEYRDGILYNKKDRHTAKAGEPAGFADRNGYQRVKVSGTHHYVHRIVFQMQHGFAPEMIDHIDGNSSNNHIDNLRAANFVQNGRNSVVPKNNTTGAKNVYLHKPSGLYQVMITINKKLRSMGFFKDFELAELVAVEARNKYYKQFARHA